MHPLHKGGFYNARTDPKVIEEWWAEYRYNTRLARANNVCSCAVFFLTYLYRFAYVQGHPYSEQADSKKREGGRLWHNDLPNDLPKSNL
jgi:hypothetical protein